MTEEVPVQFAASTIRPRPHRVGSQSVIGETLGVDESGCRVRVPQPFPHGCDPTLTLQIPSGAPVVALAAVLQAETGPGGSSEYRLVFLEMGEVDRLRLAELVDEPVNA